MYTYINLRLKSNNSRNIYHELTIIIPFLMHQHNMLTFLSITNAACSSFQNISKDRQIFKSKWHNTTVSAGDIKVVVSFVSKVT